jgi:hypothetical protein
MKSNKRLTSGEERVTIFLCALPPYWFYAFFISCTRVYKAPISVECTPLYAKRPL